LGSDSITNLRRNRMSVITSRARRLAVTAAAAGAALALVPAAASAAPPTPDQLADHLRFLTDQRILAMRNDFEAQREGRPANQSPVTPGEMVDTRVVDVTDPAGFLTQNGRRKINVAQSGLSSLVGVKIEVDWTARDSSNNELASQKATRFGPATLPFSAFKFEPRLIRQGLNPAASTRDRTLRARLKLTVDPPPVATLVEPLEGRVDRLDLPIDLEGATAQQIAELKKVDVGPVSKTFDLSLPVPVEALPVPNLLLAFRHTDYKVKHKGDSGFLLVVLPAGTGIAENDLAALQNTVNDVRSKANSLVGLAGFLGENLVGALGPVTEQISRYRDAARFGIRIVTTSEIRNLNSLTMIQNGRFTNDIEAEDEISALMTFGLPGTGWRLYADRGFKGSSLDIVAGSRFLTEARNLHTSVPAGTTRPTKNRKSWGDSFSSLELSSPVASFGS
jgi:hypothetical protein